MARTSSELADAVLPGRLAELLADHGDGALHEALDLLVEELDLRSAVLRDEVAADGGPVPATGRLRAVAGDPSHAVPGMRVVSVGPVAATTVELPVRAGGRDAGVLLVVGARPSQLPVLRAAASVIGLALSRSQKPPAADTVSSLVAAADADADAAADLLHDGPVQALVVAHYAAEASARGGDAAAAQEAVQAALVALRRSLWHLRPRGAGAGGLRAALDALSSRLEEAGGSPLGFVLDEPLAAALPAAAASVGYRLVQAVALPDAEQPVRIALRREGGFAVLDVEGGAPLRDVPSWVARAVALGGSLTLGEGRTRLAVPLAPHPSKAKAKP
jgi:hypothetical protein